MDRQRQTQAENIVHNSNRLHSSLILWDCFDCVWDFDKPGGNRLPEPKLLRACTVLSSIDKLRPAHLLSILHWTSVVGALQNGIGKASTCFGIGKSADMLYNNLHMVHLTETRTPALLAAIRCLSQRAYSCQERATSYDCTQFTEWCHCRCQKCQ